MFGLSKTERDAKKRELEIKQFKTSIMSLMRADKKVAAIKEWRRFTQCGLKEAKEVIDLFEAIGEFPEIE